MFALPALELLKKFINPVVKMFALPAVELFLNIIASPAPAEWLVPLFLYATFVPAVALFENTIVPEFPKVPAAVTKFCGINELFVTLTMSVKPGLAVMV